MSSIIVTLRDFIPTHSERLLYEYICARVRVRVQCMHLVDGTAVGNHKRLLTLITTSDKMHARIPSLINTPLTYRKVYALR